MPSSFSARCSPWFASWLNPRSLRPPMSVTRPTLIFFPAGVLLLALLLELSLLSDPHPAATRAAAAKSGRMRCRGRRTAAAPSVVRTRPGASLFARSVGNVIHSIEQGALDRFVREGRLDGGPRDRLQLTLPKAEALARNG